METRVDTEWQLSNELWVKIFLLLPLPDLIAASLVCHRFNALTADDPKNLLAIIKRHEKQWGTFFKLPGNNFINCLRHPSIPNMTKIIEAQTHLSLFTSYARINYIGMKIGQVNNEEKIRIEHESSRSLYLPNGNPLYQLIDLSARALQQSMGVKTLKYICFFTNKVDDALNWLTQSKSRFTTPSLVFIITFNKDLANLIKQSATLPICEVIEFDTKRERGFFWQDFVAHLANVTRTKVPVPDYSQFDPIPSQNCLLS